MTILRQQVSSPLVEGAYARTWLATIVVPLVDETGAVVGAIPFYSRVKKPKKGEKGKPASRCRPTTASTPRLGCRGRSCRERPSDVRGGATARTAHRRAHRDDVLGDVRAAHTTTRSSRGWPPPSRQST